MKIKKLLLLLILVAVYLTTLCGCSKPASYSFSNKYSISVNSSYKQLDNVMNEKSVIEFENNAKRRYIISFIYDSSSYCSLEDFSEYFVDNLSYTYALSDTKITTDEFSLPGYALCLAKTKLKSDVSEFESVFYIIDCKDEFVVIMCFTDAVIDENDMKDFNKIVSSFVMVDSVE